MAVDMLRSFFSDESVRNGPKIFTPANPTPANHARLAAQIKQPGARSWLPGELLAIHETLTAPQCRREVFEHAVPS
jgi:hypothetical protein